MGLDLGKEMKKGECFCDVKWKDDADCEEDKPPKPDRRDKNWSSVGSVSVAQHFDNPDDNYSNSSGVYGESESPSPFGNSFLGGNADFFSFTYAPDVLVYNKFNYPDMAQLLDRFETNGFTHDYTHQDFHNQHKVLIVPSGELIGDEYSPVIKDAIRYFVESGGTLLVLAQQYGTHVDNLVPVPEGETLKTYGWREDQSCYNGSVYFDCTHPVTALATSQLLTTVVDSYFAAWPSTATVLMKRTKNKEGALLYYPYGSYLT